ncbi:hypothetical protein LTR37_004942 [Vermiconidia calcicola]|uniref:Uncharacterized protein n=1 Tax=Vermiconidia calcicola TaxID=1690605 RepID=A0ACC3NKW0_9PEZI|nr:hypothetical protein LTR37_004942 [Vermiconidia calcicola]
MSSTGINIADLRDLVKKDIAASNDLQRRIDALQASIAAGENPSTDTTSLMNNEQKRIGKDLVLRIEQIEDQKSVEATDRTMLQELTARLGVHDLLTARLAEYRDLLLSREEGRSREWVDEGGAKGKGRRGSSNTQPTLQPWVGMGSPPPRATAVQSPTVPSSSATAGGWTQVQDQMDTGGTCDEEEQFEDEEEEEDTATATDKSTWPLLYRIMDVDPKTPTHLFQAELDNQHKALALKHDPRFFPNDPSAVERWEACERAYSMLSNPEGKKFYDNHGRPPKGLKDFDISTLRLDDD